MCSRLTSVDIVAAILTFFIVASIPPLFFLCAFSFVISSWSPFDVLSWDPIARLGLVLWIILAAVATGSAVVNALENR